MSWGNKERIIHYELFDTYTTEGCIVSPVKKDLSHNNNIIDLIETPSI